MSTLIFAAIVIIIVADVISYVNAPYEVRSGHWYSYLPGSGFVAAIKTVRKIK